MKILAIVLIVAGGIILAYRGFSYRKNSDVIKLGDAKITATTTEKVNVPIWVGFIALGAGVGLLLFGPKKLT